MTKPIDEAAGDASGARAAEYYDAAWLDGVELPGTGIVGLMLGDQLHPPMVDDAGVWGSGARWVEGARECTRRLARMADVGPGDVAVRAALWKPQTHSSRCTAMRRK